MKTIFLIMTLVNGQFSFNQQRLSVEACFNQIFSSQARNNTVQFILNNSNSGEVLNTCFQRKLKGDKSSKHNLVINAIANGNFSTESIAFKNLSACELAGDTVERMGQALLTNSGDSGAMEAFCVDTGDD